MKKRQTMGFPLRLTLFVAYPVKLKILGMFPPPHRFPLQKPGANPVAIPPKSPRIGKVRQGYTPSFGYPHPSEHFPIGLDISS